MRRREVALFRIFLTATVLLYEALVFLVLRKVANPATYLYFWVPNLAVGAAILWIEFHRAKDSGQRFVSLFRELTPFSVGVVLPIAIFLTRYLLAGNFLQLFRGVSGSVEGHLQYVNSAPSAMKFVSGDPDQSVTGVRGFRDRDPDRKGPRRSFFCWHTSRAISCSCPPLCG